MTEHRRTEDSFLFKLYRVWPIVLSLISIIYLAAKVQGKVEDHEQRIVRLESSMDRVLANTDKLVEKLVNKR